MSEYIDWIDIRISKDYVDKVKNEVIDWKQNLAGEIKTRWVGKIGEEAFRIYMLERNIPFKDLTKDGPSFVDFELNNKKIDVKTVATKYFPKEEYACNISPLQHNRNKEADTYVFARFIVPQNRIILLGWVTKHEFEINALTRMSGDSVTDKFTTNGELMELEIKYLNTISTLI